MPSNLAEIPLSPALCMRDPTWAYSKERRQHSDLLAIKSGDRVLPCFLRRSSFRVVIEGASRFAENGVIGSLGSAKPSAPAKFRKDDFAGA